MFGFEQLCGYGSLENDRGSDCVGENSAVYYFTVDYTGGGTNMPFTVQQDCNGVIGGQDMSCQTNIAEFCTSESTREVCTQKPANKNRAYWCTRAGVVGDYRVWLSLETNSTISYKINVAEDVGQSVCIYQDRGIFDPRPR